MYNIKYLKNIILGTQNSPHVKEEMRFENSNFYIYVESEWFILFYVDMKLKFNYTISKT